MIELHAGLRRADELRSILAEARNYLPRFQRRTPAIPGACHRFLDGGAPLAPSPAGISKTSARGHWKASRIPVFMQCTFTMGMQLNFAVSSLPACPDGRHGL